MIHFYHLDSDPRFPPFLLYVRWKSGVTFVRGERTGLVVRASDSGSGDPGSILGRLGVLFP